MDTQPEPMEITPPKAARRKALARVVEKPSPPVAAAADPMMSVIERLLTDPTISVERANQAFEFYQRIRAEAARRAFDAAMAAAKADIPPIAKNRLVDFTSAKGRTTYQHEDLGEIARTVDPVLARHGLFYRFRNRVDANTVEVVCVLSHRDGHYEENPPLSAPHDHSGSKNPIQAVASAVTYLQRYALKAALGLAAAHDDDGRAAGPPADDGRITEAQLDALIALADEVGADKARFCRYLGIPSLADLPAGRLAAARAALEKKKARNGTAI